MEMNNENFVHRELGKITAGLEAINETLSRDRDEGREYRKSMSKNITQIEGTLSDLGDRIVQVETLTIENKDVISNDIMPMVKKIKSWEQRGVGFLTFAGIAGTGLGVAISNYAHDLGITILNLFR